MLLADAAGVPRNSDNQAARCDGYPVFVPLSCGDSRTGGDTRFSMPHRVRSWSVMWASPEARRPGKASTYDHLDSTALSRYYEFIHRINTPSRWQCYRRLVPGVKGLSATFWSSPCRVRLFPAFRTSASLARFCPRGTSHGVVRCSSGSKPHPLAAAVFSGTSLPCPGSPQARCSLTPAARAPPQRRRAHRRAPRRAVRRRPLPAPHRAVHRPSARARRPPRRQPWRHALPPRRRQPPVRHPAERPLPAC